MPGRDHHLGCAEHGRESRTGIDAHAVVRVMFARDAMRHRVSYDVGEMYVQIAAARHVQYLQAATDRERRHATPQHSCTSASSKASRSEQVE